MNKNDEYLIEKRKKAERYRELNKTAVKRQIVCAGSSLMEMFPVEEFIKENGLDLVVYNRGIGGYIIQELLENLDACVLELEPKRLFINIGTNDLSRKEVTIPDLISNYSKVLDKIIEQLPDLEIYIMAYFPINYDAASPQMKECLKVRTNERINEANTALEELAKKYSAKYIDINDNLKDDLGRLKMEYTIEGMHIYPNGYKAIFNDFIKYASEPWWKK